MEQVTAIYLRQSKDTEGDELAIGRQRTACMKLCRERGWTPTKEYPDNDVSASSGKLRPHYQQLLDDISSGKVSRVVAWHLDRLHRDVRELLEFTDLAIKHRIKLATVNGDIDLSTDDGEFMATLGAALARKEVRRKSARQKAAAEQLATAEGGGRPWWPHRPFGFDADPDPITGKWWTSKKNPTVYNPIRLHPTEADLIRDAYRDFLAGSSLRSIANRWTTSGVTTPRGNRWIGTQVRHLLQAARNAGLRELNGVVVGRGTWPQIVEEEVWRQAVDKLADPSRHVGANGRRKYLLSGLLLCGRCDAKLKSQIATTGHRSYQCFDCQRISRGGDVLDALITEAVVQRLSREDAVELLMPPTGEVDKGALREQRRALKDRLAQLGKDFANAPVEFTMAAVADVQSKIDAIDDQLTDPEKAPIYAGVVGSDDVGKAFAELDLGRQRTIVDALLVAKVHPIVKGSGRRFDPSRIEVTWR